MAWPSSRSANAAEQMVFNDALALARTTCNCRIVHSVAFDGLLSVIALASNIISTFNFAAMTSYDNECP